MVQLMPLHPQTPSSLVSLASFKSRLVLPFWYQLTQVVLEKRPLDMSAVNIRCCEKKMKQLLREKSTAIKSCCCSARTNEGYAATFLAVLLTDSTTVQTGNKRTHLAETAAWSWADQAASNSTCTAVI